MRVIIAGGRFFDNYELLKEKVDNILKNVTTEIEIISGYARGADTLGLNYADEKGYKKIEMPANWDKYGKSAGYRRNEDMASIADSCIVFWDGKSKGTRHMIDLAKKYNLKLRIIRYK